MPAQKKHGDELAFEGFWFRVLRLVSGQHLEDVAVPDECFDVARIQEKAPSVKQLGWLPMPLLLKRT